MSDLERVTLHEGPGTVLGPYRLMQQPGEGGFGVVFLAEQSQPVKRQVALKIIKLGMDTRQVVARFEQERQALALMDHPNIARVIDAGATETGRPYFVMELVKGSPIVEYCDANKLSIEQRLELFLQVCSAIQHAHQKGIIHRDLKPSNLLIAMQDGKPLVKVIDFGIAKATSAKLTNKTLLTEQRQVIGTFQYMSPEQAKGSLDIDTRTDVYALGVVLYELLTGSTPFDKETLRDAVFSEIQRMLREVEPPRPSTRLSDSRDTLASLASQRRVEPKRLSTLVRGELDWIAMKALEKDRSRRYESASSLALDISRYLAGEAVLAAPPSVGYRLRKFVRRNRVAVSATTAVVMALIGGIAAFAWQAKIAGEQRDRALKAETETSARAKELQQVSDFQAGILAQIDPTRAGQQLSEDVARRFSAALAKAGVPDAERTVQLQTFQDQWSRVNATDAARELIDRTLLKPAIETIDKEFKDQPLVDAQLRQALATRYQSLGLYAEAMPLQTRALETRRRLLGNENADTLSSVRDMGALLVESGKLSEAEPFVEEALATRRRVLGADHVDTFDSMHLASILQIYQGKSSEGVQLARDELAARTRIQGETHDQTLLALLGVASALSHAKEWEESEQAFRSALEKSRKALGNEHDITLSVLNGLGTLLQERGRLDEAEGIFRELVESGRRVFGEEHPSTLLAIGNLGYVLMAQGKLDEAEPFLQESLEKRRRVLGPDNPITLYSVNDMGELRQAQGNLGEAESYLREALTKRRRALGEAHGLTWRSIQMFVELMMQRGEPDEVEALLRERVEALRKEVGSENESTLTTLSMLGNVLTSLGRFADAEPIQREVATNGARVLGAPHAITLGAVNGLCSTLLEQGMGSEAETLAREALATRTESLGAEHPQTITALEMVGVTLQRTGKPADAAPLLERALEVRDRTQSTNGPELMVTLNNVTVVMQELNRLDDAERYMRRALDESRRVLGAGHPGTINALRMLGFTLQQMGNWAEAEPLLRESLEHIRRQLAPDDPQLGGSLAMLGLTLIQQRKVAEAEPILRECLEIRAAREPGEWTTYNTRSLLGGSLAGQGKHDEADPLLVEGFEKMDPPPEAAFRKREALVRLIEHYEAWPKPQEAERYRTMLEAVAESVESSAKK